MISWKGAVLVLALLAAALLYAWTTRPQGTDQATINSLMPCPSPDSVYVKLEGSGKALEASRPTVRDPWVLTQPVRSAGDLAGFEELLAAIHSIVAVNTIAGPGPAAQYGLDNPRLIVTCRVRAGTSYTLSIGGESFDKSGYYARKGAGGAVYVISSVQVDTFDRDLASPPVAQSPLPTGGPSPTPGN